MLRFPVNPNNTTEEIRGALAAGMWIDVTDDDVDVTEPNGSNAAPYPSKRRASSRAGHRADHAAVETISMLVANLELSTKLDKGSSDLHRGSVPHETTLSNSKTSPQAVPLRGLASTARMSRLQKKIR